METGSRCGGKRPRNGVFELGIGTFVDDQGGYTSVAVALALLVSLSLACSLATSAWVQNRSADVQAVADATALAGANVVASYATVATTLDACVLTMGMAGLVTLGAGLVASAVPGLGAVGAGTVEAGRKVLDARQRFATSSARGLRAVEKTLPLAIAVRSAAVAGASGQGGIDYVGCAVPFPHESQTDFSGLDDEVDADELVDLSGPMSEASGRAKQAKEDADAARREGWLADCGDEPRNMCERADALASLPSAQNPHYASPETWSFGAGLRRARAYYARRAATEAPTGTSGAELTDSAARKAFYDYALAEVRAGHYVERADGTVDIDLPELPANTDEMRATRLYTDSRWPCTDEEGGRTLHSSVQCPGAVGPSSGTASLRDLEAGSAKICPECDMDATDMGKVAAASTSIDNGFEHHWRRLVRASRDYEAAKERLAEEEGKIRDLAEQGSDAFQRALDMLAVPRPQLCPPGAWGCVAVVGRGGATTSPASLARAFVDSAELPAGAAVSAATLAPDENAAGNDVLTRLFEALSEDMGGGGAGVLGSVGRLWGSLLQGYGSAADGLSSVVDGLLSGLEGIPGGSAAAWLRNKISQIVRAAGFEPADLRLRKPVLTNSQNVFDKAGASDVATVRELVERLPSSGSPADLARALGQQVANELGDGRFTVAELPIPGTDVTIPLTLDVGDLLGAMTA